MAKKKVTPTVKKPTKAVAAKKPVKTTKKTAKKKPKPKVQLKAYEMNKVKILDIYADPMTGKVTHNVDLPIAGWVSDWVSGLAIRVRTYELDGMGNNNGMPIYDNGAIATSQLGTTTYGTWTVTIPGSGIPDADKQYQILAEAQVGGYTADNATVTTS